MRKSIAIVLLSLLMPGIAEAQTTQRSQKRGLGYGYHSPQDMAAISKGISWWYNWYVAPDDQLKGIYKNYDMEFVPMIWGNSWNEEALKSTLDADPDIKYLLGFNEPNFLEQANMTPSQAAERWKDVEAVADQYGLELIGPAVNYCAGCVTENGQTFTDPVAYLDAFFAACQDCRVDYIAVHWYAGGLPWYLDLFKKYNKPLWVTEIALWEGNVSLEQQKSYLINSVDYMESNPLVFRYAWFTGRSAHGPHISLLGQDGKLTELGELYVNMPVHDPSYFHAVPARIQAQEYQRMQGIQLELTRDESGLMNVGYLEAGDWIEYNIEVAEAQEYTLSLRTAGTASGKLDLMLDESLLTTLTTPNTGGWQNWQTLEQQINLPAGKHSLRLQVVTPGFNINWLEISKEDPGTVTGIEAEGQLKQAALYPNPGNGRLVMIDLGSAFRGQRVGISVHTATGAKVLETTARVGQSNTLELPLDASLKPGLYLLKLSEGTAVKSLRLVLQ